MIPEFCVLTQCKSDQLSSDRVCLIRSVTHLLLPKARRGFPWMAHFMTDLSSGVFARRRSVVVYTNIRQP